MSRVLDSLVARLPASVQPYAKACVPVVVAAVALLGDLIATGAVDPSGLRTAAVGAATSLLVLAIPNRE